MSAIRAAASYKKEAGFIVLPRERTQVLWSPASSSEVQPVKIAIANISSKFLGLNGFFMILTTRDLQKSPATSPKASVKIVVTLPGSAAPDSYVFTFTSATGARTDQEIVVDALKDLISTGRTLGSSVSTPVPNAGTPVPSAGIATPATASNVVSSAIGDVNESTLSDSSLLSDVGLQRSLLQSNQQLQVRFREFSKSKPDSIPLSQFNSQFWQSRIHLLRAHAVERRQTQGTYNVLSVVKPKRNVDGVIKLNVSKEQIQLIFQQHPLVRKVYDDLVPRRFGDADFWGKFFVSRLFKRLKGEKVGDMDAVVPEIDAYLDRADKDFDNAGGEVDKDLASFNPAKIPRFLDIEGNEQDMLVGGNAPHAMMRPGASRVPILRALNSMSEKMLSHVKPADDGDEGDGSALLDPAGSDEQQFEELRLKDLREADKDTRVLLNVPQQSRFFAIQDGDEAARKLVAAPEEIIDELKDDLRLLGTEASSRALADISEASKKRASKATKGIMTSVKHRRAHVDPTSTASIEASGLSPGVIDAANMTSNTTIEFLSYFWSVYLAGDANRAGELANLVERLDRSVERMEAVGKLAEKERDEKVQEVRKRNEELKKLGRRGAGSRLKERDVKGGREATDAMLKATERSVKKAVEVYKKEWEAQSGRPYGTVEPKTVA
jgi:transcription initiation factor TFIIH subunit 1